MPDKYAWIKGSRGTHCQPGHPSLSRVLSVDTAGYVLKACQRSCGSCGGDG